jgi:hypothetical protein
MSDKVPMPVPGDPATKGQPDGVSDAPGDGNIHGRSAAGESGGGAYPNPHTGKTPISGGFLSHGGQTEIGYHGGGQAGSDGTGNANAAARGDEDFGAQGRTGPKSGPTGPEPASPEDRTHKVTVNGRALHVEEASGVVAAEASGMTGRAGQAQTEPEAPGAG